MTGHNIGCCLLIRLPPYWTWVPFHSFPWEKFKCNDTSEAPGFSEVQNLRENDGREYETLFRKQSKEREVTIDKKPNGHHLTETLACKPNTLFLIMTWMSSLVCSIFHRIIISTLHYFHSILGDDLIILIKLALSFFPTWIIKLKKKLQQFPTPSQF